MDGFVFPGSTPPACRASRVQIFDALIRIKSHKKARA
jgi:hypothetical protein